MKVGAKVHFFNYKMRERREELGLTQKDLSEMSGVQVNDIGLIERLCNFPGDKMPGRNDKLCRIAAALQMDFDTLFPQEYLDMIQGEVAPRRTKAFLWVKEVSLEQLYDENADIDEFLLSDPIAGVETQEMSAALSNALSALSEREQQVINMRYGLSSGESKTLEEVGKAFGVTRERVRVVEAKALRKLRHPGHRRKLRQYL